MSFQENALLGYQAELERLRGQIRSFNEEMGTDLLSQLTTEDQEEVSISFLQKSLLMVWLSKASLVISKNNYFFFMPITLEMFSVSETLLKLFY